MLFFAPMTGGFWWNQDFTSLGTTFSKEGVQVHNLLVTIFFRIFNRGLILPLKVHFFVKDKED